MIGFFDSGFGGMTILKEFVKLLPQYSTLYLGDNARTPYGTRSPEAIYQFTKEGVDELFSRGCLLVILACNTASAVALRKLQQHHLPRHWPDRKVLGIIIPTAEEMIREKGNVGIFATPATVQSRTFPIEIEKYNAKLNVVQQACPLLVPIIESGEFDQLDAAVEKYVKELFSKSNDISYVILGCTHYAIIEDMFRKLIPNDIAIISQPKIVAEKLYDYLKRHPEIEKKLLKTSQRTFLTTENSQQVRYLAKLFYGAKIELDTVKLTKEK